MTMTMTGEQVITQLAFDDGMTVSVLLVILFAMYIGLVTLAFMALWRTVVAKKKTG